MPTNPFDRLRQLALKIPEGAQELLPLIDFLETFPEQGTEEDLVHLVGITAMGIAKVSQGGLWDGSRWLFLRGSAPAFPTHPGEGWQVLPWRYGDETYGHLVLKAGEVPGAVPLLLSISAPLLAWRRAEAVRSSQNLALALQLSRLNTVFELTRNLGEVETRHDLVRLMANTLMGEFRIMRLLVVDAQGTVMHAKGLGQLPESLGGDTLHELVEAKGLVHAVELRDQNHSHGFAYVADPAVGKLTDDDEVFLHTLLNLTSSQLSGLELREARIQSERMEKDLDLARNIQRSLLPRTLPEPAGWQCAAANLPYQAVGGDLYDLWTARDEHLGDRLHFAVGDISGKGLPASLMMNQLSAYLRALADRRVEDWGMLAERLNRRRSDFYLTRSMYSPVRVSIRIFSPGPMNGGTWTLRPVSRIASLYWFVAVAPFKDGGVSVTTRSIDAGTSTDTGLPPTYCTATFEFGNRNCIAVPRISGWKLNWS